MFSKKENQILSEITVQLIFENEEIAKAINESTKPENQETLKGVEAISKVDGTNLEIKITSESSLNYLVSTIEDYFEKIDLSYKTLTTLEK